MRVGREALAAAVAFVCATAPAQAADEIATLRSQLEQVKRSVADIEARLSAVEAEQHGADATGGKVVSASGTTVALGSAGVQQPAQPPTPGSTATPAAPSAPAAAAESTAAPSAAWRRVHAGISQDEVERQLGTPTRTFELAGKRVWYYVYAGHGAGSVFFDSSGHVSSLQAPATW